MKTLRQIAEQYRADVEQRIESLKSEKANYEAEYHPEPDDETILDYDDQIKHWQVTLVEIEKSLKEYPSSTRTRRNTLVMLYDESTKEIEVKFLPRNKFGGSNHTQGYKAALFVEGCLKSTTQEQLRQIWNVLTPFEKLGGKAN